MARRMESNGFGVLERATDPQTSDRELADHATSTDPQVRERVAGNPSTSAETLQLLSKDAMASVRRIVAQNPHTGSDMLDILADDAEHEVQQAVAANLNTMASTVERIMATTNSPDDIGHIVAANAVLTEPTQHMLCRGKVYVRFILSHNPCITRDVQQSLAGDDVAFVRAGIGEITDDVRILGMLAEDPSQTVRAAVGMNRMTPKRALAKLASDQAPQVRESVAKNEQTPVGVLGRLALDVSERVRKAVFINPTY